MATRPGYIWSGTEWVSIGQEAVVAPVAYQASAPSSPSTGDIWIDSDDDVPSVNSTLYYRWKKTMSGGETSVSGTDDNSLTLAYTAGYESVFINGVLQVRGSDYTATDGTSVTGMTVLTAGDIVMVESVVAYSVGDTYTQSTLDGKFSPITTTGLVLLNTTTFSAASTVSINNCFTSTYENYRIVATITSSVTSITNLAYRLRASGTDATSGNYDYGLLYITNAGGPTRAWSAAQTSGIIGYIGNVSGVLSFDIVKPQLATETMIAAIGNEQDNSGFNGYSSWQRMSTTTAYDGITFIPASGTFTGTIKVYGYK